MELVNVLAAVKGWSLVGPIGRQFPEPCFPDARRV